MSFVHPALLAGTALGLIPIIIHMLARRRYRAVRWAAMDLLLAAVARRSRALRVQDLVLLSLRAGALVLAAIVMSRPVLSPKASGQLAARTATGPDVVIVLDTSVSMGTSTDGRTRMESARRRAHELLASLPASARVGVIDMHHREGQVTKGLTTDRAQAVFAIDAARAAPGGTGTLPAMTAAIEILARSTAADRRVYLITDARARGFEQPQTDLAAALAGADASIRFVVVVVPDERVPDLALAGLDVTSRRPGVGRTIRFEARVWDVGEPASPDANVELWVDGRKVGRQRIALADRRGTAVFEHTFAEPGLVPIEVRLDPDALEANNHRHAAICVPDMIDVAVVTGDPPGEERDSAYVYIEAALSAHDGFSATPAGPPFSVRPVIPSSRLADELDDPPDIVILVDPGQLPSQAVRRLGEWTHQGGAVLIAAGPNALATLGQFRSGAAAGRWLDRVGFSVPELTADDQQEALRFGPGDDSSTGGPEASPVDFDSPGVREALASVRVLHAVTLQPAAESEWAAVLRLTDGRPALLTRDLAGPTGNGPGRGGRLALLATSLDSRWSDLPFRAAMVPMLHDLLVWLTRPRWVSAELVPRRTWSPPVPINVTGATIVVPDGSRVPAAGFIEPAGISAEATLRFDRTGNPGVYRLAGTPVSDARSAAAVNIDPAAGEQDVWSPEQIRSLFPPGRCEVTTADAPGDVIAATGRSGAELWPALAVILGLWLLAETLAAHRFNGRAGRT